MKHGHIRHRWRRSIVAGAITMGTVVTGWTVQLQGSVYAQGMVNGWQACSMTGEAMFPSAGARGVDNSQPTVMPGHQVEVNSSVQVSRDVLRDAYQASRNAYTEKLQRYAKCSPADARKAVAAAHPGMKIEGLQLRNIRTSLVYVSVVSDDQDKYLLIVDAGNGKILMDRRLETHHERVFANHD